MLLKYFENGKLLQEYLYEKNKSIDLNKITHGSEKKIWWGCPVCKSEYEMSANARTGFYKAACPYCAGKKVNHTNSLESKYPELTKQWHPNKNKELTPDKIVSGSHKKVWWQCEFGHEWQVSPKSRIDFNTGCPYCSNKKVNSKNCLLTTHPELCQEWDYSKNAIKPEEVVAGSHEKVFWICNKCGRKWKAQIKSRSLQGCGCSKCVIPNREVRPEKSFAYNFPILLKEWDYQKNVNIDPTKVFSKIATKVWWKCIGCGHEWMASLNNRSRGRGCPSCTISKGEKEIKKWLIRYNIKHEPQKTFIDCKNKNKLPFDFYLPGHNILIEYDGEQHSKPIKYFGGKKTFAVLQKNDNIKTKYAEDKGISLIRVPHSCDNIEFALQENILLKDLFAGSSYVVENNGYKFVQEKLYIKIINIEENSDKKTNSRSILKKQIEYYSQQGFSCLFFYDTELIKLPKIVHSMILNKLHMNIKKIFSRKCEIKIIESRKEIRSFLNANHLQGNVYSSINIGLYFEDELISILCFAKPRFSKEYDWEITRFATKVNHNAAGAFSRLLKYFRTNNVGSIVTYADKRFSLGKLYINNGFSLLRESSPNYFYTKDYINLESRVKYQRHKLENILNGFDNKKSETDNMYNNGYDKIFDAGNFVFYLN